MNNHVDLDHTEAIQVARSVLLRANGLGLGDLQLRVLNSVVALTAAAGGIEAYVRLSDIAAAAYSAQHPTAWQQDKVRKALKALADHGLILRRPPVGRPRGPSYYVALGQVVDQEAEADDE